MPELTLPLRPFKNPLSNFGLSLRFYWSSVSSSSVGLPPGPIRVDRQSGAKISVQSAVVEP